MAEDKEAVVSKIKASLVKKHPNWTDDKVKETAIKIYSSRNKAKDQPKKKELDLVQKEMRVFGFIRTTYPDLEGDISPKETLDVWADAINGYPYEDTESAKGDMHHDRSDSHLTSIGEYAEVLPLDNGQYGLWVSDFVNEKHPEFENIKYEIENSMLPAYSVEFDGRNMQGKTITPGCKLYGYAHASRPVDVHAVKTECKEFSFGQFEIIKVKEEKMVEETVVMPVIETPAVTPVMEVKEQIAPVVSEPVPEIKSKEEVIAETVKEVAVKMKEVMSEVKPEPKVLIKNKETESETMEDMPLKMKEVKEAIEKKDWMAFKEAAMEYASVDSPLDMKWKEQFTGHGLQLKTTMKMKCVGNKLKIVSGPEFKFKDILNTGSNAGAYTESPVEFADLFQPGIVDAFNNVTGLLDAMPKVDIMPGGEYFGYTLKIGRNASRGFVDPDDTAVSTGYEDKLKLRQEIKVYRVGVSVADYTLYHARASLGDLFQVEVASAMADMLVGLGAAIYAENVGADGTNAFLGLEAVADSAGNATLYGKTRSTANMLLPDAAGDTYTSVAGAVSEAAMRVGIDQLLKNGSRLENIRIVTNPTGRSYLFNLLDGQIHFNSSDRTASPTLGFTRFVNPQYDGIPIIVDPQCTSSLASSTTSQFYIIDISPESGFVLGISKAPQLTGLAKVSAATSAYIEMYGTTVYKKPRNIHMLISVTS